MKNMLILLMLMLGTISNVAFALPPKPFSDCFGSGTTYDIGICYSKKIEIEDDKLNSTYQSLIKLVRNHGEEWVEDLRSAQRKWIEYRDLNCMFYGNYMRGGTGVGQYFADCKLRMTVEREKELMIKHEELKGRGYKPVAKAFNNEIQSTR